MTADESTPEYADTAAYLFSPLEQHYYEREFGSRLLKREVIGITRQRACDRQRALVSVFPSHRGMIVTLLRDQTPRRLMAPDSAEMSGDPHRAADIRAVLARDHSTRDRRGRTARRSARTA